MKNFKLKLFGFNGGSFYLNGSEKSVIKVAMIDTYYSIVINSFNNVELLYETLKNIVSIENTYNANCLTPNLKNTILNKIKTNMYSRFGLNFTVNEIYNTIGFYITSYGQSFKFNTLLLTDNYSEFVKSIIINDFKREIFHKSFIGPRGMFAFLNVKKSIIVSDKFSDKFKSHFIRSRHYIYENWSIRPHISQLPNMFSSWGHTTGKINVSGNCITFKGIP